MYANEPKLCNEIAFEDEELKINKIWTWDGIKSVYEEQAAGCCTALLNGSYSNGGGQSTFVSYDGKRLTDIQ